MMLCCGINLLIKSFTGETAMLTSKPLMKKHENNSFAIAMSNSQDSFLAILM